MIYVCGLDDMPTHVAALRVARLVSLLPTAEQPPTPSGFAAERHLRIEIDDVSEARPDRVLPEEEHVVRLIDFLREVDPNEPLLLHCMAGISRSMAAALIALVLDAEGREEEAARQIRELAPHASPNRRIVELADRLLDREGRLVAARDSMGPNEPLLIGPLVKLTRLA